MRKKQTGAAVLFVVSALLLVVLAMVLGSYKSLYFQIKRANNHIEVRQAHWLAEGGLECAFTVNRVNATPNPVSADYSLCSPSQITVNQSLIDSSLYNFTSSLNKYIEINKQIKVISRPTGAIQARSALKLIGSYSFTPEFTLPDRCISVRFMSSVSLQGGFETKPPFSNSCSESYMTNTARPDLCITGDDNCDGTGGVNDYKVTVTGNDQNYIGDEKMFGHDFVYDPGLDPFYSFFGYSRSELDSVRERYEIIDMTSGTDTCQQRLSAAFSTHDQVWVVGDCDLGDGSQISSSEIGNSPRLLVVENGILAANGANAFPGVIYQLYSGGVGDMRDHWSSDISVTPHLGSLTNDEREKLTFFSIGSFKPTGGYIFDVVGGLSVFASAIDLTFDSSSIPSTYNKLSWQRGSWHDL
ncbi:hypothetical protein ACPV5W_13345 [Vibrio astriarenae]